jgi:hypothetical protein
VEQELKRSKPKKSILKSILIGLKAIHGTAEFAAAVADLTLLSTGCDIWTYRHMFAIKI